MRDTFANSVLPRSKINRAALSGKGSDDFGTHDFYELCAHLDSNPWATSPHALTGGIDQVMEYHAAPADVGFGKVRARLGQEKPWTEVFDKIHLQFGNEVITFFGTGYPGPDYWTSLIQKAKPLLTTTPINSSSTSMSKAAASGVCLNSTPISTAERSTATTCLPFTTTNWKQRATSPGFYDWVYASGLAHVMVPENNKNWENLQALKERGLEPSIYEGGNFHSTFGDPKNAPMQQIT